MLIFVQYLFISFLKNVGPHFDIVFCGEMKYTSKGAFDANFIQLLQYLPQGAHRRSMPASSIDCTFIPDCTLITLSIYNPRYIQCKRILVLLKTLIVPLLRSDF